VAPQALAKQRRRRLCAGAKVVICGRNPDRGQEVAELLKAMNGDALFVKTDVSKAAEVESLVVATVHVSRAGRSCLR
jgi:NAD(P)-dependent dehydrogenase (short-subunit alcohol dehydrogenase family)